MSKARLLRSNAQSDRSLNLERYDNSLATREALGAIAASSQAPEQRASKRSSLFPVRSSSAVELALA
jgi:hypothetical protein